MSTVCTHTFGGICNLTADSTLLKRKFCHPWNIHLTQTRGCSCLLLSPSLVWIHTNEGWMLYHPHAEVTQKHGKLPVWRSKGLRGGTKLSISFHHVGNKCNFHPGVTAGTQSCGLHRIFSYWFVLKASTYGWGGPILLMARTRSGKKIRIIYVLRGWSHFFHKQNWKANR